MPVLDNRLLRNAFKTGLHNCLTGSPRPVFLGFADVIIGQILMNLNLMREYHEASGNPVSIHLIGVHCCHSCLRIFFRISFLPGFGDSVRTS
jgi:hypothetical protein